MLSCTEPCTSRGDVAACYCARINARRSGPPAARGHGVLSLTPGTPAHAARVAQRSCTDAEREGL